MDLPNSLLFALEKKRVEKKPIIHLKLPDGGLTTDTREIFFPSPLGFYQDLYSAETCELGAMEQLLEGVLHLAEKDQYKLESHLSFNKLTNAVKEEAVSRADLLSVEFYKDFWSLTGSEPHAVFLECLEQKI